MTGSEGWLIQHAVQCAGGAEGKTAIFLLSCTNDYADWCRLPPLIIPSHITPKASCRERFLDAFHVSVESRPCCTYPAEFILEIACQPHSANPVWPLVIFSSCGLGLWYIKEHRGLAPFASLPVWFDAVALSLGDPPGRLEPPPPSRPPSWDHVGQMPGALGHTKRLLTRRPEEALYCLLSFGSQPAIFHPSLPLFISLLQVSKVCLFHCTSVPISSVLPPLTQARRSCCSKMGWVQSSKISTKLLIYQKAFSFLTSCLIRSAPCMGISSIHRVILIDPICSLVP